MINKPSSKVLPLFLIVALFASIFLPSTIMASANEPEEETPLGMSAGVMAQPMTGGVSTITGIADKPFYNPNNYFDFENMNRTERAGFFLEVHPDNFHWAGEPADITTQILNDNGITLEYELVSGDIVFTELGLYTKNQFYARIRLQNSQPCTIEPFEIHFYLAQNGQIAQGSRTIVKGLLADENTTVVFYSDEQLGIENDHAFFVTQDVSNIDILHVDTRISIVTDLPGGQWVTMVSDDTPNTADLQALAAYPQITNVYHLSVSDNLKQGTFYFEGYGDAYRVYDGDLNYLGTGASGVPLRDTYYLAYGELGVGTSEKFGVTYHLNGAISGTAPTDTEQYYVGQRVILKDDEVSPHMYRPGYDFYGWRLSPDALTYFYPTYATYMTYGGLDVYAAWVNINYYERTAPLAPAEQVDLTALQVSKGATIHFPLSADDFQWASGADKQNLIEALRISGYSAGYNVLSGSDVVESVAIVSYNGGAAIQVKFGAPVSEQSFSFKVFLIENDNLRYVSSGAAELSGVIKGSSSSGGGSGSSGGGSSSSGGGISGSSSGRKSGGGASSNPFSNSGSSLSSGGTSTAASTGAISSETVASETSKAVSRTPSGETAVVQVKNPTSISLSAMRQMASTADSTPVRLYADSTNQDGSTVLVRMSINPALATSDIQLTASTQSTKAQNVKGFFENWFVNKVSVVSFGQQGSFGMPVDVSIKLEDGVDASNLMLYSYNQANNTYERITAEIRVDANGYLHVTLSQGGDLVISQGALQRK